MPSEIAKTPRMRVIQNITGKTWRLDYRNHMYSAASQGRSRLVRKAECRSLLARMVRLFLRLR
jgi:hypothetical protein